MKKALFVTLLIALAILFLYLVYKTWDVFGFWNLIWTGLVLLISNIALGQLIGCRKEINDEIMYNPKEWPKFINSLISLAIGAYLYSIIDKTGTPKFDFIFGLFYILIFILIPVWISGYNLVYNRNDFISISKTSVKYKDNQEFGNFPISDLKNAELVKRRIKLTLTNGESCIIKTDQMNFNYKDIKGVVSDIKNRISG